MQGVIYQNDKEYPRLLKQIGKSAPKQLYFRSGNSCAENSHSAKFSKTKSFESSKNSHSEIFSRFTLKGSDASQKFQNAHSKKDDSKKDNIEKDIFENCLAVVGSRKLTSYGEEVIERIVSQLTMNGITIVSGFMYGGDAAAHQAAIRVGGRTIAVMPCGIDLIHPAYQQELYQDILKNNGLIISEYEGKMKPVLWTYPQRNRIIAGLSKAVLVIEAGEKSGSLITANYAKKFKRKIFAVPGPITGSLSRGTNLLIKQGAKMVLEAKDILKYFNNFQKTKSFESSKNSHSEIFSRSAKFSKTKFFESLNPACASRKQRAQTYSSKNLFSSNTYSKKDSLENQILDLLAREPMGMDELARELGMGSSELGVKVSMMEIKGKIKQKSGKYYVD